MILNIKNSKKNQVFEILEKQGYILDNQSAKIFGEEGLYKVHDYVRMYRRLEKDKQFFAGKNIVEIRKGHRCHLARTDDMKEGTYYKVGKDFYCSETPQRNNSSTQSHTMA